MNRYSVAALFILTTFVGIHGKISNNQVNPPHCTQVTKTTDYQSRYKYDYPTVYIPPGQMEAYQHLFCINPPTVNKATTVVCDWAAPPQVQYTLGDEYMHVVRQDPTGRYLVTVAELEVEAAALLHAEVWFNFIEAQKADTQNVTEVQSEVEG